MNLMGIHTRTAFSSAATTWALTSTAFSTAPPTANGSFVVRGFGPAPFMTNGGRGEMNAAVHKAAGSGQPVTQKIVLSVEGDKAEYAINGTVVASYDTSAVVGRGKLKSTDGVYGIRSRTTPRER